MKSNFFLFKNVFLSILFVAFFFNSALAQKDIKMIFGKNGIITYEAKQKTIAVSQSGKTIFSDAKASVIVNGKTISVTDYSEAVLSKETLNDNLGKGTKYSLTYTDKNNPTLIQNFYTYNNQSYFITQIEILGAGQQIAANYISPLDLGKISFDKIENLQTVFVPYDNDAFISYNSKKLDTISNNTSAEVGILFNNTSRNGFIIDSLEHTVWKSAVKTTNKKPETLFSAWAGYAEKEITRDSIAHGLVKGNKVLSPKFFVGYYSDWRNGMEEYAKTNRIVEKPYVFEWDKPTPVGWNSWGVLMEKINFENTTKVADFFAKEIPQFRVGNTAYIDLDSFWDNMVKGGFTGDFSKLKEFADYCKSKGLEPGAYWAPFTDWGWKDGPNRKAEGSDYTFGEMWTKTGNTYFDFDGARAIDPTHPGTLKRVDYVINKLKACGFKMIKIDFLGHAAAESTSFYDKNVTTGMQAYKVGMEHLVNALDGQMLIYAAISPNMATSRYAHVRRIACDAWKTIEHTQYTLNSVNYGWWQTYSYDYIDADHVVFADVTEGENRARLISAVITGTLITGDDYSKDGIWSVRAKEWLQNKELLKIVSHGVAFRPVEGNTGKHTTEVFEQKIGNDWYIAVLNYGSTPKNYSLSLERLGIKKGNYQLQNLFTNQNTNVKNNINVSLGSKDAHLYKIINR
ncbi:alpha-galactosidase [Flavobacterium sp. CF108]|uniref:alpha-galactosidase n=1 Tax=unclassified Flavobacterium TaxID=196869 RepID=UPI0008B45709|nr:MULTISPECIES: alpha-galactosidase [unclassified Flavobacterium]SEO42163.1 alpha-galactosidase [Flavobacterium sp. fv08]SHH67967.1 alpha-galactosidase [Flavobacterium sp. CF108]